MSHIPPRHLAGALLSVAAFALFAAVDSAIKFLGNGYNPFQIIFFVTLMSFPIAFVYAATETETGGLRPNRPGLMAIRCVLVVVNGVLGTYAFTVLPLAECYAIFFTMPIFVTLLAIPFLGQRVDAVRGLAILAGLAGVIVALDPAATELQAGHLAALFAAVFGAGNYLVIGMTGTTERPVVMQIYPVAAQCAVAACVLPFVYRPMPVEHLGLTAVMALLAFIGYLFAIAAWRRAPASIVSPMHYTQIIWAALFGALLFDEHMGLRTIAGTAIIIVAGLVIVGRRDRSNAVAPQPTSG